MMGRPPADLDPLERMGDRAAVARIDRWGPVGKASGRFASLSDTE